MSVCVCVCLCLCASMLVCAYLCMCGHPHNMTVTVDSGPTARLQPLPHSPPSQAHSALNNKELMRQNDSEKMGRGEGATEGEREKDRLERENQDLNDAIAALKASMNERDAAAEAEAERTKMVHEREKEDLNDKIAVLSRELALALERGIVCAKTGRGATRQGAREGKQQRYMRNGRGGGVGVGEREGGRGVQRVSVRASADAPNALQRLHE